MPHVVTRHPNLPGYPCPLDIAFYGLEEQAMPWEQEMKNDIEWNQLLIVLLIGDSSINS